MNIQAEYDLVISKLAKPISEAENYGIQMYLEELHDSLADFRKQARKMDAIELDRELSKVTDDLEWQVNVRKVRGAVVQAKFVALMDETSERLQAN